MAGTYYKVTPPAPKFPGYGFKKVSQDELVDIVSRLSKPTYNSQLEGRESSRVHNYRHTKSAPPPRTPSFCSRRYSIGSQSGHISKDRKLTEQDLQRLIRRVRRPTTASQRFRKDYPDDPTPPQNYPSTAASPHVTASERKKAFHQLSRPTTASRGKHAVDCHLCTEEDKELNSMIDMPFDYPYGDDRSVTVEEVGSIISRIRTHTRASKRGQIPCWKTPPDLKSLRIQSENLPLVSGLERSKSVAQIVERLHSSKGSRRHGYVPQATTVTNYYTMS